MFTSNCSTTQDTKCTWRPVQHRASAPRTCISHARTYTSGPDSAALNPRRRTTLVSILRRDTRSLAFLSKVHVRRSAGLEAQCLPACALIGVNDLLDVALGGALGFFSWSVCIMSGAWLGRLDRCGAQGHVTYLPNWMRRRTGWNMTVWQAATNGVTADQRVGGVKSKTGVNDWTGYGSSSR